LIVALAVYTELIVALIVIFILVVVPILYWIFLGVTGPIRRRRH
jgi:hypothetical protein